MNDSLYTIPTYRKVKLDSSINGAHILFVGIDLSLTFGHALLCLLELCLAKVSLLSRMVVQFFRSTHPTRLFSYLSAK